MSLTFSYLAKALFIVGGVFAVAFSGGFKLDRNVVGAVVAADVADGLLGALVVGVPEIFGHHDVQGHHMAFAILRPQVQVMQAFNSIESEDFGGESCGIDLLRHTLQQNPERIAQVSPHIPQHPRRDPEREHGVEQAREGMIHA